MTIEIIKIFIEKTQVRNKKTKKDTIRTDLGLCSHVAFILSMIIDFVKDEKDLMDYRRFFFKDLPYLHRKQFLKFNFYVLVIIGLGECLLR